MAKSVIVDERGRPLSAYAHEGADLAGRELGTWYPGQFSADGELLPELETLRDRTRDLIRNNGVASGAVQMHVDNVIGSGLLLNAKPDRRALGLKGEDRAEEMDELEDEIEAKFDAWSEDVCCYVDASRKSRFSGLLAQAYRSYLMSFEILATGEWLPRRGSLYSTAVQMIDPARLSNPLGKQDDDVFRGGVERGPMGEPVAYHIASHVESDFINIRTGMRTWDRVARETTWGRQMVIHVFDNDQPGQSRGKNGITAVLLKHKMLDKFAKVSLEAAAFNAMYAAYIQSSLDWPSVAAAMGASTSADTDPTLKYLQNRVDFHEAGSVRFNGLRVPHLFPGEELKHLTPQHPTPAFNAFEEAALRYLAAGWNLTYEQLSRDYSKTNYSSARAALLEAWRFFSGKQYLIGGWFATQIYALWLEEALDRGEIVLPAGLPDFYAAKTSWCSCEWIGPGRGHIDPLKEANANKVRYQMNLETLESLAAQDGRRWREIIDQRAQETRYAARRGVDISQVGGPTPVAQPPDAPDEPRGSERQPQPA
jgi:lambda family phage portal protein